MYNYITGRISNIYSTFIVLENNGIGYLIKTANPYSFTIGDEMTIYTHVHIRQDVFDIYGFKNNEEKDLFIKLISVKGIGPKGALAIIANGDPGSLEQAIISGDVKYLQKFPGIGQKASSQIVLDLQGKLTNPKNQMENPKITDVKDALKSLGYKNAELRKLDSFLYENIDLPIEELVKTSLKKLF
jgi:Holliday junction DNA helicase RuvA